MKKMIFFLSLSFYGLSSQQAFALCKSFFLKAHHRMHTQLKPQANGIPVEADDFYLGNPAASQVIVLIHSYSGGTNNFNQLPQSLLRLLGPDVFLWAPRLLAHGTTPSDLETTQAEDWIGQIEKLTETLRPRYRRIHLIGHSMGASLAMIAAASNPYIHSIVGATPYFVDRQASALSGRDRLFSFIARHNLWVPAYPHQLAPAPKDGPKPYQYRFLPGRSFFEVQKVGMKAYDVLDKLPHKNLFILGKQDKVCSLQHCQHSLNMHGLKNVQQFNQSAHQIFWDQESEDVNQVIGNFLLQFFE